MQQLICPQLWAIKMNACTTKKKKVKEKACNRYAKEGKKMESHGSIKCSIKITESIKKSLKQEYEQRAKSPNRKQQQIWYTLIQLYQ